MWEVGVVAVEVAMHCIYSDPMNKKLLQMPKFRNQGEEADWWASPAGRAYVKQKSAQSKRASKGPAAGGSRLVAKLNKKHSVQIAIRLPEADLAEARDRAGEIKVRRYVPKPAVAHEPASLPR